jgi:hypothetical protein
VSVVLEGRSRRVLTPPAVAELTLQAVRRNTTG